MSKRVKVTQREVAAKLALDAERLYWRIRNLNDQDPDAVRGDDSGAYPAMQVAAKIREVFGLPTIAEAAAKRFRAGRSATSGNTSNIEITDTNEQQANP